MDLGHGHDGRCLRSPLRSLSQTRPEEGVLRAALNGVAPGGLTLGSATGVWLARGRRIIRQREVRTAQPWEGEGMTDTMTPGDGITTRPISAVPALAACVATLLAVAARSLLASPPQSAVELLPGWVAAAGALLGALAGLATLRSPTAVPQRAVLAATWIACALLVVETADGIAFDVVGVVMHAVSAVTGDPLPIALAVDWPGIAVRVLAAVTAVLLGRQALTRQRAAQARCAACGRTAAGRERSLPSWPAYAACVLALGYAAEKIYWGLGGTFGLASEDAFGDVHLWTPGLGDTAVLALVGAGLALALVRPWGRRLPRWLLLAPAALGTLMLIPVGILGTYGTLRNFSELSSGGAIGLEPWVFLLQYPWFLAWGLTLGAAAVAFHDRTRGPCRTCGRS